MKAILALSILLASSFAHADLSKSDCRLAVTVGRNKPVGFDLTYKNDESGESFQYRDGNGLSAVVYNFKSESSLEMSLATSGFSSATASPLSSDEHILTLNNRTAGESYVLSCLIRQ